MADNVQYHTVLRKAIKARIAVLYASFRLVSIHYSEVKTLTIRRDEHMAITLYAFTPCVSHSIALWQTIQTAAIR